MPWQEEMGLVFLTGLTRPPRYNDTSYGRIRPRDPAEPSYPNMHLTIHGRDARVSTAGSSKFEALLHMPQRGFIKLMYVNEKMRRWARNHNNELYQVAIQYST